MIYGMVVILSYIKWKLIYELTEPYDPFYTDASWNYFLAVQRLDRLLREVGEQ